MPPVAPQAREGSMGQACWTGREQFPYSSLLGHPVLSVELGYAAPLSTDLPELVCWGFKCRRRKRSLQFVFDNVFSVQWPQKTNESEGAQDPVWLGHC